MQTGAGAKTFALAESAKSLFENSDESMMLIKTSIPSDWLNYRSQIEYSKQPFLTDIEIKGVK